MRRVQRSGMALNYNSGSLWQAFSVSAMSYTRDYRSRSRWVTARGGGCDFSSMNSCMVSFNWGGSSTHFWMRKG